MLKGKTIVLGVTGGIAIYKSLDLVSRLRKEGANVEVIMTDSSKEFVNPLAFQTMSNNLVHHRMFSEITNYDVEHISLAKKADLVVIAPATANTIGKIANGIADNLLTTVVMATTSKVLLVPAMNTQMYLNPLVEENMGKLEKLGYEFINPSSGLLACGDVGKGKMAEPVDILDYIKSSFVEKDLQGIEITITAGPTIEPIDPVRFMSNRSSGKMGYSIAKNALDRGARVNLISGPSKLDPPRGANLVRVNTTLEMKDAVEKYFEKSKVLIKSAAPSDYRPKEFRPEKMKKKDSNEEMQITYVENPDIAAYFGRKKGDRLMVGFAAETTNLIENALGKIAKKNFDFIVANDVTKEGAGFDIDTNIVSIINKDGHREDYPMMEKTELAVLILDKVKEILKNKS